MRTIILLPVVFVEYGFTLSATLKTHVLIHARGKKKHIIVAKVYGKGFSLASDFLKKPTTYATVKIF